jgi:hypothetical protein
MAKNKKQKTTGKGIIKRRRKTKDKKCQKGPEYD